MNFLILATFITLSSAGYIDGYSTYLRQLGLTEIDSMSTNNSGLNSYNQHLVEKNVCFGKLVQNFYEQITIKDSLAAQHFPERKDDLFNNMLTTTETENVESGWLWTEALKMSQGNSNLAMMLIGACGHDDVMSVIPNQNSNWKYHCEVYKALGPKISGYTPSLYRPGSCSPDEIELMGYNKTICPVKASRMYLPGSLSKETLLDTDLVQQIIHIQAPHKGGSHLPSKYYHTLGAAYLTCQLKMAGVTKTMARATQLKVIRAYRHRRLCKEEVYSKNNEEAQYTSSYITVHNLSIQKFTELLLKGALNGKSGQKAQREWTRDLKVYRSSSDLSVAIANKLASYDASTMLKTFVYTNSLCLVSSENQTQKIKNIIDYYHPEWLSEERQQAAKKLLNTWWIDIVWSQRQHELGVDFAYDHCKADPQFLQNIDKVSCEALSK